MKFNTQKAKKDVVTRNHGKEFDSFVCLAHALDLLLAGFTLTFLASI